MRRILLIILSLIIFSCSLNDEPKNGIVLTYHNSWPIFLNEYFKSPIKEKITYKDGLRHGEYISYFDRCGKCQWSNEIKEKGSYKNDLKDGEFIIWQRGWGIDPVLKEKVTYKDGLRHGMTIIYTEHGSKQEEINFKNDVRDGKYRKYYGSYLEEESFYSNGKKNGKSFVYPSPRYKNFEKYASDIGYDPRTGYSYKKNRVVGHNYKNNIPENTYGLIQVYTFKDGVEDGEFLSYYHKGVLETTGSYKDGKVHGFFVSYYRNGLIASESYWANGLQNGPYTDYHNTTSNKKQIIDAKGNTINGVPFGPFESYYINGQLRNKGVFDENGNIIYGKSFYENGKLKKEFLEKDLEKRIAAKQRENRSSSSSSSSRRSYSRSEVYSWYSSSYPSARIMVDSAGNNWRVTIVYRSGRTEIINVPK